jgi:hypothetical protein
MYKSTASTHHDRDGQEYNNNILQKKQKTKKSFETKMENLPVCKIRLLNIIYIYIYIYIYNSTKSIDCDYIMKTTQLDIMLCG